MFEDAKEQMLRLPHAVQLWMRWLNIVFLLGLPFIVSHVEARWVLFSYIVAFPVGLLAFIVTRNIKLTGIPHFLFWTPLLVYLPYSAMGDPEFRFMSLYGIWVSLLCITIAISVAFDLKALIEFCSPDQVR